MFTDLRGRERWWGKRERREGRWDQCERETFIGCLPLNLCNLLVYLTMFQPAESPGQSRLDEFCSGYYIGPHLVHSLLWKLRYYFKSSYDLKAGILKFSPFGNHLMKDSIILSFLLSFSWMNFSFLCFIIVIQHTILFNHSLGIIIIKTRFLSIILIEIRFSLINIWFLHRPVFGIFFPSL